MEEGKRVFMTCMTTKQKFEAAEPNVVVLRNGRYAYKVECPWKGKQDKTLHAFKFCGSKDYEHFMEQQLKIADLPESEPEIEPEIG